MPLGALGFFSAISGGTLELDTTITSANQKVGTTTPTKVPEDIDAIGFDAGSDAYSYAGTFGSIASGVYTDGDSNSRTIDSIYWNDYVGIEELYFVLDTTSVPNVDATFSKIVLGSDTFLRSAATYFASQDGGTMWQWDNVVSPGPIPVAGNPHTCEVWVA